MTIRTAATALTAAIILNTVVANAGKLEVAGVRIGNPFDSSTWGKAKEHPKPS